MVDYLDVGFNIVIGLVIVGILFYTLYQIWTKIKKEKGNEDNEELNSLMKTQKLMEKK